MGKVISLRGLKEVLRGGRRKVVFTNGCFDILHAGHVRYLKKARSLGDMLVVGLNSDSSIKKIKGKDRPIVNEKERAEILSALESVDYVVVFKEETPIKLIESIRPKVLAKGADWSHGNIVGQEFVESTGGRVVRVRLVKGRSTTDIIKKISRLSKK